ncbi:hypothetical protein [Pantoea sp. S62]|uniref:hypothetical protein n=1 Tax=Pantoea sp. S62 TaxID=2769342 RepID=UPI001912DDBD|nr:hypothetical protein [Pantoea sp. S62]MBK5017949.1 hypothetical protein [Pantoea sp. S62]
MKGLIRRWRHPDNRVHAYVVLVAVMLAVNFTVSGLTMRDGLTGFPGWQVWRLALLASPVIVLLAYLFRDMAVMTFWAMVVLWLMVAAFYLVWGVWFWAIPIPDSRDILFMAGFTTGIAYFFTLLFTLLNIR